MDTKPLRRARYRQGGGFTLIELMIVVALVAVLAAVALPSYMSSVKKSRRSDAITAISQVQQAQERYRANQASYGTHFIVSGGSLTGVGVSTDTNAAATYTIPSGYYSLSISNPGATTYNVLATPQGSQTTDSNCGYMEADLSGGNTSYKSGATSSVANGTSANNACWKR
ncbi:MAG: type IV pilin protein [Pseudomonadota bacterium]